jgi:hypothetical protein
MGKKKEESSCRKKFGKLTFMKKNEDERTSSFICEPKTEAAPLYPSSFFLFFYIKNRVFKLSRLHFFYRLYRSCSFFLVKENLVFIKMPNLNAILKICIKRAPKFLSPKFYENQFKYM